MNSSLSISFLLKASLVLFPLSTLIAKPTTYYLYVIGFSFTTSVGSNAIFGFRAFVSLACSLIVLSLFHFLSLFLDPFPLGRTPGVKPSRLTSMFPASVTAPSHALSNWSRVCLVLTVLSVPVVHSGVYVRLLRRIDWIGVPPLDGD